MEKKRSNWAVLMLFLIFVMLLAYISVTSISIYREAEKATAIQSSIYCNSYVFDIEKETIEYFESTLTFELMNKYGEEIKGISIWADGKLNKKTEVNFSSFYRNSRRKVSIPGFAVERNFSVSPKGCEKQNWKTFEMP